MKEVDIPRLPKTPKDFLPGDPTKLELPLPKFLLEPTKEIIFAVGDEVRVLNEPTLVGLLVAGLSGEVIDVGTHPYGEKYGTIYLVRLKGGDFWFVAEHLEKLEGG